MSRSRTRRALAIGGLALALPASAAAQGSDTVRDLVLPSRDIVLSVSSTDRSISTAEAPGEIEVTLAADVLFAFDRASLTGRAGSRIDQLSERVRSAKPPRIRVQGHTDSKGSPGYNRRLSKRRADAVAKALRRELGASVPTLSVEGRGESDPTVSNTKADGSDDPRGRARNRRVTISFPG